MKIQFPRMESFLLRERAETGKDKHFAVVTKWAESRSPIVFIAFSTGTVSLDHKWGRKVHRLLVFGIKDKANAAHVTSSLSNNWWWLHQEKSHWKTALTAEEEASMQDQKLSQIADAEWKDSHLSSQGNLAPRFDGLLRLLLETTCNFCRLFYHLDGEKIKMETGGMSIFLCTPWAFLVRRLRNHAKVLGMTTKACGSNNSSLNHSRICKRRYLEEHILGTMYFYINLHPT